MSCSVAVSSSARAALGRRSLSTLAVARKLRRPAPPLLPLLPAPGRGGVGACGTPAKNEKNSTRVGSSPISAACFFSSSSSSVDDVEATVLEAKRLFLGDGSSSDDATADSASGRDVDRAVDLLKGVADGGHPEAQYLMGIAFASGSGVEEQDYETAVRWLTLSADQGFAEAQFQLGEIFNAGKPGVPRNIMDARKLWRRAADQGHHIATLRTRACYFD